jgi:hypothetical protein
LRPVGDLVAAAVAFYGAFLTRIQVPLPLTARLLPGDRLRLLADETGIGLALAAQLLVLYLFGFYDPPEPRPRLDVARRLLDVTDVPGVAVGDPVTLLGREGDQAITAEEWAARIGTINYEVFCLVDKRVPRIYREAGVGDPVPAGP